MYRAFIVCGIVFAAFLSGGVRAQIPATSHTADPQWLRQQEREVQRRQQLESRSEDRSTVSNRAPIPQLPADESPCFVIREIKLDGDMAERFFNLIDSANRAADGADDTLIGRCIGTTGLGIAIRRMQNELLRRGYVTTRVLAGPQDLTKGVFTVTLIPGRLRTIRFATDTSPRATSWNAMPFQAGDLLNLRTIEQALENFKRLPSAEADILIEPANGKNVPPGYSDLVVQWRQRFPFRFNLYLDNSGLESTGRYMGTLTLSYDHALTLNDLLYVSLNHSLLEPFPAPRGTAGGVFHYSLPYGPWLLGATINNSHYRQPVPSIAGTTIYSGNSGGFELRLSRLLMRDARSKTSAYLSLWSRQSRNYIADLEIAVQRREVSGWEAGVTHRQRLGHATLDLNAGYRRGTGIFGSHRLPNEASEGSTQPQLLQLGALYNLPFAVGEQRLRYSLALRAQRASTSLLAQDRFSIGSRFSVRGFNEQRVLSADEGWLMRNDLGISLGGSGAESYLGLDYGEVNGRHSEQLIGTHLTGIAVGVRGGANGLAYDLFAARALSAPKGFYDGQFNVGFSLSYSF